MYTSFAQVVFIYMLAFVLSLHRISAVRLCNRFHGFPHRTCTSAFGTGFTFPQSGASPRTNFIAMAPRTREKGGRPGAVARSNPNSVVVAQARITKSTKVDTMSDADRDAMLRKGAMIKAKLEEIYPETPRGFLTHKDSYTLLISVLLSAQSLDNIVNQVTPGLFHEADTPEKMIVLGEERIRAIIKPVGLSPQKAKNIVALSKILVEQHGSQVPADMDLMEKLPGVGHKTAGVVAMNAFGIAAFPVDTHIHRLACRWGCGFPKSVAKTEESLKKWFPDSKSWRDMHLRIIQFGRDYCPAMRHDMDSCPICSFAATNEARAANAASPKKFVGALSHETPYAIREIESSVIVSAAVSGTQTGSTEVIKKSTAKSRSTAKKNLEVEATTDNADLPWRKPRSGRQAKTKAKALLREEDDEGCDEDEKDGSKLRVTETNAIRVAKGNRKRKQARIQDEDYGMDELHISDDDKEGGDIRDVDEAKFVQQKQKKSRSKKKTFESKLSGRSIKLRLPVRKPGKRGEGLLSETMANTVAAAIKDGMAGKDQDVRIRGGRGRKAA